MIRVAVIGHGHLGKWHTQKVQDSTEASLVAIVEPNKKSWASISDAHPGVSLFQNVEECIDDFDAAIVVTPTSFHFEVCQYLLNHDKHIFCEKPMTSTVAEGKKLQDLFEQKKIIFQVGHSERFHRIWNQLAGNEKFFKDAPIIHITRQAPFKGRATDVDVVQDLMIHDIDLLLFLLKETPKSVEAHGKKMRTDKWDYVFAKFFFESGTIASIRVGRNNTSEIRELEVNNHCGSMTIDLLNQKQLVADVDKDEFVSIYDYEKRDLLFEEQKRFYQSINVNAPIAVSFQDGMNAVIWVEEILKKLNKV